MIADRFGDASVAYQGWARGLGEEVVGGLNSFAVAGTVPDRTFLLDLGVAATEAAYRSAASGRREVPVIPPGTRG